MKDRMFNFITEKWNPIGGRCRYDCYNGKCWATILKKTYSMAKYADDKPYIVEKELERKFGESDFVFIQDMGDAYGSWLSAAMILRVLKRADEFPNTRFLSCTKNPKRYADLNGVGYKFSSHHILGCTLETNRDLGLSKAPVQSSRLEWLKKATKFARGRIFVSIEPIMDFDLDIFTKQILNLRPWGVAVGYNNYDFANFHLPEPSLTKTSVLIKMLKDAGITIFIKTIRKAWNEQNLFVAQDNSTSRNGRAN